MRVVFFGSTQLSCRVLGSLAASRHEVVAVVTQPDQPAGRNMNLAETAVCNEAQAIGMPVLKPEVIRNNAEFRRTIRELRPDAYMTASYGKIISKKTLDLVEYPLNVHPSKLPQLRGASPARTALLQGLTETGCCIMRMTPRLDDGDVMLRRPLPVGADWNFFDLLAEMGRVGGEMAVESLDVIESGAAEFHPQDHDNATYCGMYTRDDTIVDWSQDNTTLANFVRAWDPDVGACTQLADGRRLKIWRAAAVSADMIEQPATAIEPGRIACVSKKHIWVACGTGLLRIDELQPENKSRMPAANFLAGNQLEVGSALGAPVCS